MKRILPTIVIAQFFCTSVWFAGNAIMGDIAKQLHLEPAYLAHLTSAVQLGFIAGTLIFAVFSIADRFSPVKVFCCCAMIAAVLNLGASLDSIDVTMLIICRFATGFFLAGIYPVGMKIASDHYQQGLSKSLGFLVGALVLGTAFPHFLKSPSRSGR
jgi:MFS family permease